MDLRRVSKDAARAQVQRERCRRRGVNFYGYRIWTKIEDRIVRNLYPDYVALRKALPLRSYWAIQSRACYLGISKKRKPWTSRDLQKLGRIFSQATWAELYQAFPGRTQNEIKSRARKAGYTRPRVYPKTGVPVLDSIRSRAFSLNLSLLDVDKMARTRSYFSSARPRDIEKLNWKAIRRAVKALDGEVMPTWKNH